MNTYGQQKEEKHLITEMLLLFSLIVAEHDQVQYLSFAPLVIIAIKTCFTFGFFSFVSSTLNATQQQNVNKIAACPLCSCSLMM